MRITLGVHLDSRQGPSRENVFDAPVLGRLGLLDLLETHLGLARLGVSRARRVTRYLGYLRQHEDQPRFYSRSLQADSIGTAAKLLAWRDELLLAGWDGNTPADAPRRLLEMALIEQSASGDIEPGEAERLSIVTTALTQEGTQIESVLLMDPFESFPFAWRKVLALLPNVKLLQYEPQGQGQLRQLQELAIQALRDGHFQALEGPITDSSVLLAQASTREVAEHWFSAFCRDSIADRLLVCEFGGDSLDATLMVTGAASCGFQNPSELRPALQAVGLALEMCWIPVDVGRLIEFLSHPVGPFSRKLRASLARAVANQPGIGGEAWEAVKNEIPADDSGKILLDDVAFWLEGDRWTRGEGAPVDALLARVDRLATTLHKHFIGDDASHAILAPAIEQCFALRESLIEFKSQHVVSLTSRQIEQLIIHATPTGAMNPDSQAQVGCLRAEANTGACIEAADEVIWWMPSTPQLPSPLPWSQTELEALTKMRVNLRNPLQELEALSIQWLRPLLSAKQRFILVLPPAGTEDHPFRQLFLKLAPDLLSNCIDLDVQVSSNFVGNLSAKLTRIDLPQTPRYMEFSRALTLPIDGQSYSSLSELYNDPALYALKRIARLHSTTVLSAEEDNRLLGTLAHRVFEKLFQQPDYQLWAIDKAIMWFRGNVDELLEKEGASLRMLGAGVSQQRFKGVCEDAIRSMLKHLQSCDAISVRTEFNLEGKLGDVHLVGKADLIVDLPGGRVVVLDMKWRGDKFYANTLREGQHLQLALYSSLFEQQTGVKPVALGYFILVSGGMYVTANDVMPQAHVHTPPFGTNASLFQQAKESWKWRAEQWINGQIEVVPIGSGDEFQGPEGTLPVEGPKKWDKDHLVLLGGWIDE